MNSSPPLISRIRWNVGEFGKIREISGNFRGIPWGFVWRLVGNSGGFRGNAGFSGKFGVWGGFGRFGA